MLLTFPQVLRMEVQQAVYQYFQLGAELVPTEADFSDWLAGLPPSLTGLYRAAGFTAARHNPSFKRFLLEVRGFSLHEHLTQQLSPAAFAWWLTLDEHGSGPDANRWALTYHRQLAARQQERFATHW
ncbi:hypothetical protein QMK33_22570 [Hymenobacter sp. H14-R3]|uniref:hypothetical protein n=1 Tax=Hymenobacter sp. H14-R3 TaxID=3046308 RepID=UPI0024B944F4|nr:hypothetical protein [Hymenobacter sp. H14-R3]MDJ0367936.1 hypothetical protein [Hymenobacter sp. H14-R3]